VHSDGAVSEKHQNEQGKKCLGAHKPGGILYVLMDGCIAWELKNLVVWARVLREAMEEREKESESQ
jgi:hypothetical protein